MNHCPFTLTGALRVKLGMRWYLGYALASQDGVLKLKPG
jgi:hypothetical protein